MSALQTPPPIRSMSNPAGLMSLGAPGFPAISAGPGAALRPVAQVPGQSVALPGSRLSRGTRRNKSGQVSNEPIVTTVSVDNWKQQAYQESQKPGDLLWVRKKEDGNGLSYPTVSQAQVNEILRMCYDKVQTYSATYAAERSPFLYYEGTEEAAPDGVMKLYDAARAAGERVFTQDVPTDEKLSHDRQYSILWALSPKHILEAYKWLGTYASDGGRWRKPHLVYNVQVGGPTTYQETWNVWGNVREGHSLFLILTRRLDMARSQPNRPVYGEFYFKPWYGHVEYPPKWETRYHDDAGHVHYGPVINIGKVYRIPLEFPSAEEARVKAGVSGNSAAAYAVQITTVSVNLTARRVCKELYAG